MLLEECTNAIGAVVVVSKFWWGSSFFTSIPSAVGGGLVESLMIEVDRIVRGKIDVVGSKISSLCSTVSLDASIVGSLSLLLVSSLLLSSTTPFVVHNSIANSVGGKVGSERGVEVVDRSIIDDGVISGVASGCDMVEVSKLSLGSGVTRAVSSVVVASIFGTFFMSPFFSLSLVALSLLSSLEVTVVVRGTGAGAKVSLSFVVSIIVVVALGVVMMDATSDDGDVVVSTTVSSFAAPWLGNGSLSPVAVVVAGADMTASVAVVVMGMVVFAATAASSSSSSFVTSNTEVSIGKEITAISIVSVTV